MIVSALARWLLALALSGVAANAACVSARVLPSIVGEPARGQRAPEPTSYLHGTGSAATVYDGRSPAQMVPPARVLFDELVEVARSAGRDSLLTDDDVVRATADICRGLPSTGPPAAAVVGFALHYHGLIDPPPHLVVADVPLSGEVSFSPKLRIRLGAILRRRVYRRGGVAICRPLLTPGRRRVVVTLFEGGLRLEGLPRRLVLGQSQDFRATIRSAHRHPKLVVADPRGKIVSVALRPLGGTWEGRLRCEWRGATRVEVTAVGAHGTEVLANFPVFCGVHPPEKIRVLRRRPRTIVAEAAEEELVRLTNGLRQRHGLSPLRVSLPLREVARAHSRDMRDSDFVGHVSPRSGGPGDRVRRAKIAFVLVRENVARAYSAREALDELAKSPAHLANLLNTDTSRVGVGVVIDRSQSIPLLLITQNFVELPARFVAATADRDARAVLAKARRRAGLGDIVWSPGLAGLARLYLVDYQRLGPKQADGRLGAALRNLGAGYQRVSGMLLAVQAIAGIGGAKELLMPDIAELGLAVVEKRPGRILIFVLVARRR